MTNFVASAIFLGITNVAQFNEPALLFSFVDSQGATQMCTFTIGADYGTNWEASSPSMAVDPATGKTFQVFQGRTNCNLIYHRVGMNGQFWYAVAKCGNSGRIPYGLLSSLPPPLPLTNGLPPPVPPVPRPITNNQMKAGVAVKPKS